MLASLLCFAIIVVSSTSVFCLSLFRTSCRDLISPRDWQKQKKIVSVERNLRSIVVNHKMVSNTRIAHIRVEGGELLARHRGKLSALGSRSSLVIIKPNNRFLKKIGCQQGNKAQAAIFLFSKRLPSARIHFDSPYGDVVEVQPSFAVFSCSAFRLFISYESRPKRQSCC